MEKREAGKSKVAKKLSIFLSVDESKKIITCISINRDNINFFSVFLLTVEKEYWIAAKGKTFLWLFFC